ncbi:hypothetical protein [Caldalkalibacillus mannanilyticus]|uniref:hypothetical protein n=1 Tax=Caldalkalibacillus mannanilyticus TaxID=1418 RepID=UPI00046A9CDD|nr:hypothetical protein [Caldalkalibacillus mannanilyticus]
MKMTKKKYIYFVSMFIILGLLVFPALSSYMDYRESRISNEYEREFYDRLLGTIKEETAFKMTDITTFQWDRMHIFPPYTSRSEMENKIGRKWTERKSYLSYLIERKTIFGEHPLDDDRFHSLVFLNGDAIVLDITLDRVQVDFTHNEKLVLEKDTIFIVELNEDGNRYPIVKAKEE